MISRSCYGCIYLEDQNVTKTYCGYNGESINPDLDRCKRFDDGSNEELDED